MDAYVSLVRLYSLLIAAASILLAVLRLGSVAKKIPKPVMSGFKWGAAIVILAAQVSDMHGYGSPLARLRCRS